MSEEPLLLAAPDEPKLLPAPKHARPAKRSTGAHRFYWIAAIVLLSLLLIGWFFHHRQASEAKKASERQRDRLPDVGVTEARPAPATADLLLPGSVMPITEASLYARASGYLRARYADIGDTVRRGQVLAEIDSPDLDQQVMQGRAAVAQAKQQLGQAQASVVDAKAKVSLANVVFGRAELLGRTEAVARQEVDQRRQELDTAQATLTSSVASVGAAEENVRAGEASAQRLVVLQNYEKLRAPFDGVVTARNVDVGTLIGAAGSSMSGSSLASASSSDGGSSSSTASGANSGGSSSGGLQTGGQAGELYRVAQIDRLRVFVSVPQENAAAIQPGDEASVFVAGNRDPFDGRVTRTARSLDPNARTLLTEVQIDNARHVLMPGVYAQVRFHSLRSNPPILVPGEAVIAKPDGVFIASIEDLRPEDRERLPKTDDAQKDADKVRRVHLQQVQVGRDYGTEVEITDGLRAGTTIVANPGDETVEDALVVPKKRKPADQDSGKLGGDKPASGNQSPSMKAPTKSK